MGELKSFAIHFTTEAEALDYIEQNESQMEQALRSLDQRIDC